MKRLLILILGLLLFSGCSTDTKRMVADLKTVLADVYAPESIEQFNESREKYEGDLLSEYVTDRLYVKRADTLTEADLTRSIEFINVKVSRAENNSVGRDIILITAKLSGGGTYTLVDFKFYIDNGQVVDYSTEIKGE